MERVSDDTIVAAAFPEKIEAIRTLRLLNEEFDEICSDFAALARLVGNENRIDPSRDIQESLAGLHQDIEAALRRFDDADPTKEGRSR